MMIQPGVNLNLRILDIPELLRSLPNFG